METEALYARYMASARKAPKMGMRAYLNPTVAQALAYALGIEEVPPSDTEFARLTDYYGKAMMVSSQQEFDAFVVEGIKELVQMGPPKQVSEAPSIEVLELSKTIEKALSRQGISTLTDLFTKGFSLTERQAHSVKEAVSKFMDAVPGNGHLEVDMTETDETETETDD